MTTRRDWPLLALRCASDGTLTPVQMQKAMFLMEREARKLVGAHFYEFAPYDYGPFDSSIYQDVDSLATDNLLLIARDTRVPRYVITTGGIAAADAVMASADMRAVTFLKRVVEWIKPLPFDSLLKAIYTKYPDFAVNSVFKTAR